LDLPHCRYPRKPSPLIFRRIHASCRHLEPPPRCSRRRRDCVPLEGLSRQRPRPWKTMRLHPHEFIRRFLIHVLPKGFHRIRHYGLLANRNRSENIAHARELLAAPARPKQTETPEAALEQPGVLPQPCPSCGGCMIIIKTFAQIRAQAPGPRRRGDRYNPASASPKPRHNPHNARGTAATPSAISCLGAFWTPDATARGSVRHAGVQKPAQQRTNERRFRRTSEMRLTLFCISLNNKI
jgi:hypothetical protein